MSRPIYYRSVSEKFPQYPKNTIYQHVWTERRPDGDSGLRDSGGADSRLPSNVLQDPRYFVLEPADPSVIAPLDGGYVGGLYEGERHHLVVMALKINEVVQAVNGLVEQSK